MFFDNLEIPEENLIGREGAGFKYILDGLNAERTLIAAECIGDAYWFVDKARKYASERVVFNRPIGQNQGIQHPLAERWMYLESAWMMAMRAAALYDAGKPCGAEANSAKFLGGRAGHDACWQAIATHGGMGYAKEYHVERLLREVTITRIAPITEQLILSFVAEMDATIRNIHETANTTETLANEVSENARLGREAVNETVDGIRTAQEATRIRFACGGVCIAHDGKQPVGTRRVTHVSDASSAGVGSRCGNCGD